MVPATPVRHLFPKSPLCPYLPMCVQPRIPLVHAVTRPSPRPCVRTYSRSAPWRHFWSEPPTPACMSPTVHPATPLATAVVWSMLPVRQMAKGQNPLPRASRCVLPPTQRPPGCRTPLARWLPRQCPHCAMHWSPNHDVPQPTCLSAAIKMLLPLVHPPNRLSPFLPR
jgi:hypothetical protein